MQPRGSSTNVSGESEVRKMLQEDFAPSLMLYWASNGRGRDRGVNCLWRMTKGLDVRSATSVVRRLRAIEIIAVGVCGGSLSGR